jgi:hypothetical protein
MKNYFRIAIVLAAFALPASVFAQEVTLYGGKNFKGRSVTLHGDTANFERLGFNDQVSSLRVRHGKWELCTDSEFRGRCRVFEPGDYASLGGGNNAFSSARPVHAKASARHPRIVLFEGPNHGGRSVELDARVDNLERIGFNDRVDSIVVERGSWMLCSDSNGRGECREFGPGRHRLPPGLRSRVSSAYPR